MISAEYTELTPHLMRGSLGGILPKIVDVHAEPAEGLPHNTGT